MCSITTPARGPVTPAALSAAVAHSSELGALVAGALADPSRFDLGALQPDQAAALTTELLAVADRATAAATVLAGHVASTTGSGSVSLIAGRYASPRRWLEVDAGLAPPSAKAVLARARDLREHSEVVAGAWLAGQVSGDAVRELTSGVTSMLKPVPAPRVEKDRLRAEALDLLLPLARLGTPADLKRALGRLRLLADPDGATQAAMDADGPPLPARPAVGETSL